MQKIFLEKKKRKDILLTFDYELFLGSRSGTVNNCLINPTYRILKVLKKHQLKKALFFVDTTYIKKLLESDYLECSADYLKIENQLCDILKKGHLIFPHLHPHWLDAVYVDKSKQWNLSDTSRYRIHNVPTDVRLELLEFSIFLIKKIQLKTGVEYDINCYRAGGWCIQPFEDFVPLFNKYDIKNDFSVLKHFKNQSPNTYYDFIQVPKRSIYRFNKSVNIEDHKGPFTEYSISNIRTNNKFLRKLHLKYLSIIKVGKFGDGISIIKKNNIYLNNIDRKNLGNLEMASIELLNITSMSAYKKYLRYNSYCHFISHPKMLNSHNLRCFDKLLSKLQKEYHVQTDYDQMN